MTGRGTDDGALYSIDNLPYGVYSVDGGPRRIATRIGNEVVDLGLILGETGDDAVFSESTLNAFMAQGRHRWVDVRQRIQEAFASGLISRATKPLSAVRMHLPVAIADYVDFYASEHHAANLGRLFRPDSPEPLTPNWRHLPIGYHGRSGSIVVSGTDVVRPRGQRRGPTDQAPAFGPTLRLDIEAELGFLIGVGSAMGTPIDAARADEHIFGVVLFNDWSARDIQAWEYVPLGPHLGKSFASTISPWVVPMLALNAARVAAPPQKPAVLPYLAMDQPWGLDIDVEVEWNGQVISTPPYAAMYWSPAQMLAHMTVNGAPARTGDLFASGTISGPDVMQRGAFIELTWGGSRPVLVAGEERTFLLDGDEVVLRATAPGQGGVSIGFGEARGTIVPSPRE